MMDKVTCVVLRHQITTLENKNAELQRTIAELNLKMRVMQEVLTKIGNCQEHPECNAARLARATLKIH